MLEVEKKAFLDDSRYGTIGSELVQMGAVDLGQNDTETHFFLGQNQQLKIANNISKAKAKVAWKSDAMGSKQVVKEIECSIAQKDVSNFVHIFKITLADFQYFYTNQLRHDYSINGLMVSIKKSRDWGYHLEIDQNCSNSSEADKALAKIYQLAANLRIELLSEEQEKQFVDSKIKSYKD